MHTAYKTHIICFGNPLHGDDGFGPAVFDQLCQQDWPDQIKIFNAGTSSLTALNLFDDCDYAIVVDACYDQQQRGTLRWHQTQTFTNTTQVAELSSHGLGVRSILQGLEILKEEGESVPEIDILTCAVEMPEKFTECLTSEVQEAVTFASGEVFSRLGERGVLQ